MPAVPTDGQIKKMAIRKAPLTIKMVEPRSQPKSRGGRALYTGLCRVARNSRSDAATVRACELLGILEGHWTKEDLNLLKAPAVEAPKVKPEASDAVLEQLKKDPKLAPLLPETGAGLEDLAAKYGLTK